MNDILALHFNVRTKDQVSAMRNAPKRLYWFKRYFLPALSYTRFVIYGLLICCPLALYEIIIKGTYMTLNELVFFAAMWYCLYSVMKLNLDCYVIRGNKIACNIDAKGITVVASGYKVIVIQWQEIQEILSSAEGIMIVVCKPPFLWIPNNAFRENEMSVFLEQATENLAQQSKGTA